MVLAVVGVGVSAGLVATDLPVMASLNSGVTVGVLALIVATLTGLVDPPADAEPLSRRATRWGLAGLAVIAAVQAYALVDAARGSDRDGVLDHGAGLITVAAVLLLLVVMHRRQRRSAP